MGRRRAVRLRRAPPSRYAYAGRELCADLRDAAGLARSGVHIGSAWTTTAHFRLSLDRLHAFRDEGCLAIDNEAATAFAVGQFRNVEVACLLHVGLTLWRDRFEIPEGALFDEQAAAARLDAAIAALTRCATRTGVGTRAS